MSKQDFASDYVDVATRIAEAKAAWPDLSLRAEIVALDESRVIMRAMAYRTPTDEAPGIGHAWEPIPGRTPFTRGSELMVCETSAWGRALAALGIATKNGIATREEVAAAAQPSNGHVSLPDGVEWVPASEPDPSPQPRANRPPANGGMTVGEALDAVKNIGSGRNEVNEIAKRIAGTWSFKEMTPQQRRAVIDELMIAKLGHAE